MITNTKQLLAALALVAMSATSALAQLSDAGSPLGAGAGVGGSVAPLGVPNAENGGRPAGGSGGLSGNGMSGLSASRTAFMNASAGGASVSNPATGGSVNLSQNAAHALGGVLGGRPTPAQLSALRGALTGMPQDTVASLTNALAAFGANANHATLTVAVRAYNNALASMPAGATPSPALLAIRSALLAASRR